MTIITASAEDLLPVGFQWVLGAALVVGALALLWDKVFRPTVHFASAAEEMLPLLRELTATWRDVPAVFEVLKDLVAQTRSDSGSTLKDALNRIEDAIAAQAQVTEGNIAQAQILAVGVEAARQLAERDRQEQQRQMLALHDLSVKVDDGLDEIKTQAQMVAANLLTSQQQADAVSSGRPAGEAADAGSHSAGWKPQ